MLLRTTNSGVNWINLSAGTSNPLNSVYYVGNTSVYAAGINGTILKSTNGGVNWHGQNSGTNNILHCIYFVNLNTGYVVGVSGTILKTTDGGELVGIKPISEEIPQKFFLSQNYPNPFNPATKIKFSIPDVRSSNLDVRLVIYDIMGKEAASLVKEKLSPGNYEIVWDAGNYSSGIYFYKLIVTSPDKSGEVGSELFYSQ